MKNLYLLYLFLIPMYRIIPIEMPFFFFSTFIALFGFSIHVIRYGIDYSIMGKWINQLMYMIIYTVIMAAVTYSSWGVISGETTFDCILSTCVLIITLGSSLYFNYIGLSKYVTSDDLIRVLKLQNYVLLSIAIIQLMIIYGFAGPIGSVYNLIATHTSMVDVDYLTKVNRGVCLFGSEPSSAAGSLIFSVPFAVVLELDKKKKTLTIAWLIVLCLSGSSQTIASLLVIIICYLFIKRLRYIPRFVYIVFFLAGLALSLFYTYSDGIVINTNMSDFEYVLYGKALSFENYSVMAREATVINDIKVFMDYPITGIGDGIQGVLYNQNVPIWTQYSWEVESLIRGDLGIANGGGNFFPAFLSGYGLIGVFSIVIFINKYKQDISLLDKTFLWNSVFSMGVILFLLTGWQTVSVFNNEYMAFVLSIPYIALNPLNDFSKKC